jgi:hypothetical protein
VAGIVAVGVATGVVSRSTPADAIDPFADGVVTVAVSTGSAPTSSTAGLFLDAAARAITAQLAPPTLAPVDLAGAAPDDRESLTRLGVEHLLELRLGSDPTAAGKLYSITATVSDAQTGAPWRELPRYDMTTLDFDAVEAASSRIARSYVAAVSEALPQPREELE